MLVLVCILVALAIIYFLALVSLRPSAARSVPLVNGTPLASPISYLPRQCASVAERAMGSWTSFQPRTPTIL